MYICQNSVLVCSILFRDHLVFHFHFLFSITYFVLLLMQFVSTHSMSITPEATVFADHHDLHRSDTLSIHFPGDSVDSDSCIPSSLVTSENQFIPIQHVESLQHQNSISFMNLSCNDSFHSAFTPVRKRERNIETSPVCSIIGFYNVGFFYRKVIKV